MLFHKRYSTAFLSVQFALCFLINSSWAQTADSSRHHPYRVPLVVGGDILVYAGAISTIYGVWYKDHDFIGFHWHNDNKGWLQIDKCGHAFSSYVEGFYGYESLLWAGVDQKKSAIYGGGIGMLLQTSIETLDAFSDGWGASPGDLIANTAGSGLFIGQALLWKEQRIKMKFSYSPSPYTALRPGYFGATGFEHFFTDYNAHTYWLSVSPRSFWKNSCWPAWLNIATGYGADGMLAENFNPMYDDGRLLPNIKRQRQFYLSPDIDLSAIKTKSRILHRLLCGLNIIKIPAPAVEYGSAGRLSLHWFYF